MAARCSNLTQIDEESNIDGASDNGGGENGGGAGGPSDLRLKHEIQNVGELPNGLPLYRFKYTWSDKEWVGVMAQDVLKVMPQAVSTGPEGYYRVNYRMLGSKMLPYAQWLSSKARQVSAAPHQ